MNQENPYQSPNSSSHQEGTSWILRLKKFLFCFNGRISRKYFWFYQLLFIPMILVIDLFGKSSFLFHKPLYGILLIVLFSSLFAVYAKRCHDRDKSAWWTLVIFIPIIGGIVAFIDFCILPGTRGPNRYGDEPV